MKKKKKKNLFSSKVGTEESLAQETQKLSITSVSLSTQLNC